MVEDKCESWTTMISLCYPAGWRNIGGDGRNVKLRRLPEVAKQGKGRRELPLENAFRNNGTAAAVASIQLTKDPSGWLSDDICFSRIGTCGSNNGAESRQGVRHAMRIEWLHAHASVARFEEEMKLLEAERAAADAIHGKGGEEGQSEEPVRVVRGKLAYAHRQANVFKRLAVVAEEKYVAVQPEKIKMGI
ncbi:hypothetical protein M422DRAFT_249441 [Sphaerobolus stellatus SS14]|uniref:Uncharacterized protein n=1 Tax=Sphaerobolus stellatus (strain SS14) TaxID=990650 RepID=A0A0C9VIJ7_SPHS4|nr:hypothetical protein M422DRAFT_249441 [Sphaerobolus stellatus SS14]